MPEHSIFITVRLLDGRYHGVGDWPPSPFRLFQAFMSAASAGRTATDAELKALTWLEGLDPPVIAAPKARKSKSTTYFVPRNGADAFGGDLARAAKKRDPKNTRPWLFEAQIPFLYAWTFEGENNNANVIASLTDLLYQFGRGVDMAYATSDVVDIGDAERRLDEHDGTVHRPTMNGFGNELRCPKKNASLKSLTTRHLAQLKRLTDDTLRQAPPAVFQPVSYDSPPTRLLFDIIRNDSKGGFGVQPIEQVVALTERIRNHAAARLASHVGGALVERIIIGRNAGEAEKEARVRIIPLPSIGFVHADRQVRRMLVEVPSACPIQTDDIAWALSGLDLGVDAKTGEILDESGWLLVRCEDRQMLSHYGVEVDEREKARVWRTVTPVALHLSRQRGRIGGQERAANDAALAHAARQALRHAGLDPNAEVRCVQREPFEGKGVRAEAFAHGERFPASRLHYLEIAFAEPMSGPIVLGDGRFLGLGLCAPVSETSSPRLFRFAITTPHPIPVEHTLHFAEQVRTALLGLARMIVGPDRIPSALSGHETDGGPLRRGPPRHILVLPEDADGDGVLDHLLLWLPKTINPGQTERVASTATRLAHICLGEHEVAQLQPLAYADKSARCGFDRTWISTTPYLPTRFPKTQDRVAALGEDVVRQCRIFGIPVPEVQLLIEAPRTWMTHRRFKPEGPQPDWRGAFLRLLFPKHVEGPLALGRHRHLGLGAFRREI